MFAMAIACIDLFDTDCSCNSDDPLFEAL